MKHFVQKLTDILVKKEKIPADEAEDLKKAFEKSENDQFDDFLLAEGLVQEPDLLEALSDYFRVPSFDVTGHFFDAHQIHMFPKDFLLRNGVIPLEVDENIMVVVASEPEKSGLESSLRDFVSYDITFYVGIRRDITDAVKEFYDESLSQEPQDIDMREERRQEKDLGSLEKDIEEFPVEEEEE